MSWYASALGVGLASSMIAALWLFVVDGIFLSDTLTLSTSLAVVLFLPIVFAVAWRKRSTRQRVGGAILGVAGACIGVFGLMNLVGLLHRNS